VAFFIIFELITTKKNKMKNHKKLIILFILSILLPYISNILLIREFDFSFIILIPIYLISLTTLIIVIKKIAVIKSPIKLRKYKIIGLISILIFFISFNFQINISEYISYQRNKIELIELVNKIKNSNIEIMTDEYENLNGYSINNWGFGKEYPLDSILKIYHIDKQKYEDIRRELINTKYKSISKLKDGTIFFTKGGMIDNCYGIVYSPTGIPPKENNCGEITKWHKIYGKWYSWATT